jgi:hypothetical protein
MDPLIEQRRNKWPKANFGVANAQPWREQQKPEALDRCAGPVVALAA